MSPLVPEDTPTINKSLKVHREKYPDRPMYDASQGDGGASLPGTPLHILERAAQLQLEHGTATTCHDYYWNEV